MKLTLRCWFVIFSLNLLFLSPILIFFREHFNSHIKKEYFKRDYLSGDGILSIRNKVNYLTHNFISGISGYGNEIKTEYWFHGILEKGRGFPTRKMLNQFIKQEVPKMLPIKKINVLDIGCGSGYVRKILSEMGYAGSYTGVDVKKHSEFDKYSRYFESKLVESRIEEYVTDEKFDLILSITALEHIENDELTIAKCDKLITPGGIQLHIVPSYWSLFVHFWHGFRIYSPEHISHLFNGKKYRVYRLGGIFTFFLILTFITIPVKIFSRTLRNSVLYPRLINTCNRLDRKAPFCSHLYLVTTRARENDQRRV